MAALKFLFYAKDEANLIDLIFPVDKTGTLGEIMKFFYLKEWNPERRRECSECRV